MAAGEHDDYCLEEYRYLYSPDILRGKVAFITGGGSGIGFRIAEIFMRHGCDTAIASRKIHKLEEVRFSLGMCSFEQRSLEIICIQSQGGLQNNCQLSKCRCSLCSS